MSVADILARAEALYEAGRKRVSGRPPWAKLDPSDPYDMGMRDEAIRQAEAGISPDPAHDAEVAFLTALAEGRQPGRYCGRLSAKNLTVYEHNAALYAMRAINKARQRSRRAGRAFWQAQRWSITDEGRAWLAGTATPPRTATALEVGR